MLFLRRESSLKLAIGSSEVARLLPPMEEATLAETGFEVICMVAGFSPSQSSPRFETLLTLPITKFLVFTHWGGTHMRRKWSLFRAKQSFRGKGSYFLGGEKGFKGFPKYHSSEQAKLKCYPLGLNTPGTPPGSVHTHFSPVSTFLLLGFSSSPR